MLSYKLLENINYCILVILEYIEDFLSKILIDE